MAHYTKVTFRKYSPQSLQKLCVDMISKNLLQLSSSKIGPEFSWLDKECNPLAYIPIGLFEDIMDKFIKEVVFSGLKSIKKDFMKVLLCRKIRKLDLASFAFEESDMLDVLKTIAATKSDLIWFSVFMCNAEGDYTTWKKIPHTLAFLKKYIKTLTSLTHLYVYSFCDDELLEIVGSNCPHLKYLVAASHQITSKGLKSLCKNTKDPFDRSKRCVKLQQLNLDVGKDDDDFAEGIAFVLQSLPALCHIQCSNYVLYKALSKLFDEYLEMPKLQLRKLDYYGTSPCPYLPHVISKTCPYLRSLSLFSASSQELKCFDYLPNLSDVFLGGSSSEKLDFYDDVAPFLKMIGKSVDSLTLSDIKEASYTIIDEYCPKLKKLELWNIVILHGGYGTSHLYKNLEEVGLRSHLLGIDPESFLRLFSKCPCLQTLTLVCGQDLKMDNLSEILKKYPLTHLNSVTFSSPSFLFIGTPSDLKTLMPESVS